MICVFVSRDKNFFSDLEQTLTRNHMDIEWIDTGKKLLSRLSEHPPGKPVELVIIDEEVPDYTARQLVEHVITQSPMTNCVATSALSPKKFHDTYEGLGVLMQLPRKPSEPDAKRIVTQLNKILRLSIPRANADKETGR